MTLCFGSNPYERLDWIPPDGTGLNPQLQNPGMAIHPPNLYLGYIGTAIPVRVRDRGADHAQARRGVARRRAPLDARLVVLQHDGDHPRHVVGVRRARMGRLLGVGSRRERVVPAVAREHRVPALDHGAGEARHAAQMERDARRLRVPARDSRHVHHAQRHHLERALVRAVERRLLVPRLPRARDRVRRCISSRRD